jgi:hypothetical protein
VPLSRRSVAVHGIDLSAAMVARLRAKPGGDDIEVTIGDFATTRVDRTFRLAYLVFNTIMNLASQDKQVACFANAAAHLGPGTCFLIEVLVPDLQRLPSGSASTSTTSPGRGSSPTTTGSSRPGWNSRRSRSVEMTRTLEFPAWPTPASRTSFATITRSLPPCAARERVLSMKRRTGRSVEGG